MQCLLEKPGEERDIQVSPAEQAGTLPGTSSCDATGAPEAPNTHSELALLIGLSILSAVPKE